MAVDILCSGKAACNTDKSMNAGDGLLICKNGGIDLGSRFDACGRISSSSPPSVYTGRCLICLAPFGCAPTGDMTFNGETTPSVTDPLDDIGNYCAGDCTADDFVKADNTPPFPCSFSPTSSPTMSPTASPPTSSPTMSPTTSPSVRVSNIFAHNESNHKPICVSNIFAYNESNHQSVRVSNIFAHKEPNHQSIRVSHSQPSPSVSPTTSSTIFPRSQSFFYSFLKRVSARTRKRFGGRKLRGLD